MKKALMCEYLNGLIYILTTPVVLNYQIIKIISDVKIILGKDLGKYNITVLSILNLFLPCNA